MQRATRSRRYSAIIALGTLSVFVERVDFFSGRLAFKLTPFLAMTPLLVLALVDARLGGARLQLRRPGDSGKLILLLYAFLVAVTASLFVGQEALGMDRAVLLGALLVGGGSLVTLVAVTENVRAFRLGLLAGIGVYLLFDVYQAHLFATYGLFPPPWSGAIDNTLVPYGEGVIRYTGGSVDPNRAALTLALATYMYARDDLIGVPSMRARHWVVVTASASMVILTLSRTGGVLSAILFIAIVFGYFRSRRPEAQVLTIIGAAIAAIVVMPRYEAQLGAFLDRFSLSDASASQHVELIRLGVTQASSDWRLFTGYGFGQSYTLLGNEFGSSNKYGNYHSLYVTMLVEIGIVGALAITLLLALRVHGKRKWVALALLIYNAFYQSASDPIFWVIIFILWTFPDATSAGADLEPGEALRDGRIGNGPLRASRARHAEHASAG